jgi:hypothetical protein
MFEILLVLLSLLFLFANGAAILYFLNYPRSGKKFSNIEVLIYSFPLGYAVLTLTSLAIAQFGFLVYPINLFAILIIPVIALCLYTYRKQIDKQAANKSTSNACQNSPLNFRLSSVILLSVFALAIILRLETQLNTPFLGDTDPYYHLTFIDSIIAQGTIPSRTLWGFYSYLPSFHTVFATLISTTQVDRFLFMKIVPEFLGFLSIPAAYLLISKKYGEWPGIASAAFLAISSIHIYRTNIAIPESVALLGIVMFFLAFTTQTGLRKHLLAGIFASMIFLTNIVSSIYFIAFMTAIFIVLILSNQKSHSVELMKATGVGLLLSGIFWLPTIYHLGLEGILQGLGPQYPQAAINFTSNTYFSWIGWGTIVFAVIGVYVCLKDFRNHIVFIVPIITVIILLEASNNGYNVLEANLLFRGLLYLGTWVTLLAGIGFWRVLRSQKDKIIALILVAVVIFTMISFPIFSNSRYPMNYGNENVDFVYRSYLSNYSAIFKSLDYRVYSGDSYFNYGAFNNVILEREMPQLKQAISINNSDVIINLLNQNNVLYLILINGTTEADFFAEKRYAYKYYENWHTIVFIVDYSLES